MSPMTTVTSTNSILVAHSENIDGRLDLADAGEDIVEDPSDAVDRPLGAADLLPEDMVEGLPYSEDNDNIVGQSVAVNSHCSMEEVLADLDRIEIENESMIAAEMDPKLPAMDFEKEPLCRVSDEMARMWKLAREQSEKMDEYWNMEPMKVYPEDAKSVDGSLETTNSKNPVYGLSTQNL